MKTLTEEPPGPRGRRLVGNTYDYDKDRLAFLIDAHRRFGDVVRFSSSTIVISDPQLIQQVFSRTNTDFLAEAPLFPNTKNGEISTANISSWMKARRLGWHGMNRSITRQHGSRLINALDNTLSSIEGREFNVVDVMREYTGRMITDFCLGPESTDVAEAVDLRSSIAVKFMASNFTYPKWLPHPTVRRALKADVRVESVLASHVRQRRLHSRTQPQDLLDLLLNDEEVLLSDQEIVRLLRVTLLASYGSPGAALAWIVRELVARPEIQLRIREEATELLLDTGSLTDDFRLPYTRGFVKEILRLYPPTWLMGRGVAQRCWLGPWILQPGQTVMFSPYVVHRDPRWWADANDFLPERWLESSAVRDRGTYFPFGAGPRICLGNEMGEYQLITATAHLAVNYELRLRSLTNTPKAEALLLPTELIARAVRRKTPEQTTMESKEDSVSSSIEGCPFATAIVNASSHDAR